MPNAVIRPLDPGWLEEYSRVSIAFEVRSILRLVPLHDGWGGFALREETVAPWIKDYDAVGDQNPVCWGKRYDVSRWGLFGAFAQDRLVGGAAVAFDTPELQRLEGRRDLAALWDIRVEPSCRRSGVGGRLFAAAAAFARNSGCIRLKAETQNINLPACRFYARQGCVLGAIDRFAYDELPDETMLDWCLPLRDGER